MPIDWARSKIIMGAIIFLLLLWGCRTLIKPIIEEKAPGIDYKVNPLAKLTKVTLYEGKDNHWWIDISLKNVSDKKQAFRVSVKVDDWPAISSFTGGGKRSELEPQKEETVKLQTLSRSIPKTLTIEIAPYP